MDVLNWGCLSYQEAYAKMRERHADVVKGVQKDCLILVEHPPVITKGRRLADLVLPNEDYLKSLGIDIVATDRGGLLTYHGPGQVVIYFVLRLQNYFQGIGDFVEALEKVIVSFLKSRYQMHSAQQIAGHNGVWIGSQKIASLGLRVQDGVTLHGISLNVKNDLNVYQLFDPCGLSGQVMTRLCDHTHEETNNNELSVDRVGEELIENLKKFLMQKN